jgi:hypothetical protein
VRTSAYSKKGKETNRGREEIERKEIKEKGGKKGNKYEKKKNRDTFRFSEFPHGLRIR